MTSRAERERHVAQMLANSRLEGLEPDKDHVQILQAYIEGTASLSDLWEHARDYASRGLPTKEDLEKINRAWEAEQAALRPPPEPSNPEVDAMVAAFFAQLDDKAK